MWRLRATAGASTTTVRVCVVVSVVMGGGNTRCTHTHTHTEPPQNPSKTATPFYPASYAHDCVMAVASTNIADELSGFSNVGFQSVDIAAPGSAILSTYRNQGYAYLDGTSMATPHVTGAAALVWSASGGTLTGVQIKGVLMETADRLPALKGKVASEVRRLFFP